MKGWYASLLLKFLDDDSYASFKGMPWTAGNAPEAFRGAHTLKGVAQNLGFGPSLQGGSTGDREPCGRQKHSSGDMEKAAEADACSR